MVAENNQYYQEIIEELGGESVDTMALLRLVVEQLRQTQEKVDELSNRTERTDRRLQDLYSADFPKAVGILENAVSEDLKAETSKFYCFDAIDKNKMYVIGDNSEKVYVNKLDEFKAVFDNSSSIIKGKNAYLPVMNGAKEILGVVAVENGNYTKEAINSCQTETSKFFSTTIEKENQTLAKEHNKQLAESMAKTAYR
ncbi:MAG: hypothetical protein FWG90_01915 [Oscillospiraceae bacterium]|nr:hypothetical protein [Oscillospiraceae bacterium]